MKLFIICKIQRINLWICVPLQRLNIVKNKYFMNVDLWYRSTKINTIFLWILQWINYIMINIYLRRTFKANYKRHKLKHKNESRTIKLLINKIEWDCDKKIPKRHKHTYIVSYIQNIKKGIWLAYYCESDRFYNKLKKNEKNKRKILIV